MYGGSEWLSKCKLKADIDPGTWKYIALPWTTTGKAARGLPDASALGKLINQGIDATTGLATSVVEGKDPFASVSSPRDLVNLVTGNTSPAGVGGPLGTNRTGYSVRMPGGAARAIASGGSMPGQESPWYSMNPLGVSARTPTALLLTAGVVAAAWFWLHSGNKAGAVKVRRRSRR
jgi:hypothetical protein